MFDLNIVHRIFGTILLLPIIFFVYFGNNYFYFIIGTICFVASLEYCLIVCKSKKINPFIVFCTFILWSPFLIIFLSLNNFFIILLLFLLLVITLILLKEFSFTILIFIFILCNSFLIKLENGNYILLFISSLIISNDVGAYFFGKLIGGFKLAPSISPSKTWAGFFGGILFALIVSIIICIYIEISLLLAMLLAFSIGVLAQLGDLVESILKRKYHLKDSSNFIPGHGGVLDRFDGYLLVLPFTIMADFFLKNILY